MSERPGVVNMHLAVNLASNSKMIMLYKLSEGVVKEEHYGLSLARVIDLPPLILDVAEGVSSTIKQHAEAKKKSSSAFAVAKKRKLVLSLREMLVQARDGPMEGRVLVGWLRKLQEEFVVRMSGIEGGEEVEVDDGVTTVGDGEDGTVVGGEEEVSVRGSENGE